jgi:hypothetical protein
MIIRKKKNKFLKIWQLESDKYLEIWPLEKKKKKIQKYKCLEKE